MHFTPILLPLLAATNTLAIPTHLKPRCSPCEIMEIADGALGAVGGIAGGALDLAGGLLGGLGGGGVHAGGSVQVSGGAHAGGQPCNCEAGVTGRVRLMARGLGVERQMEGILFPVWQQ